jgi:hypothetical protein
MKRLRWAAALAGAGALVLVLVAGLSANSARTVAGVYTIKASACTSNGDLINGWYWQRNNANTAQWTFNVADLQGARKGSVYLNVTGLVTKGVNGGSGISGGLSVQFVGARTVNTGVYLTNPFRPKDLTHAPTGYTQGVGYYAYGAVAVPFSAYNGATSLQVIVSRNSNSVVQGLHIAVNKDSPLIAYVK